MKLLTCKVQVGLFRQPYQQSIAKGLLDDARYPADVLCCIQEQHQVHASLVLQVVLCQIPLYTCEQAGLVCDRLILLIVSSLRDR